jgi:oxygen-independent coproporphyrinogen-3 oxidase
MLRTTCAFTRKSVIASGFRATKTIEGVGAGGGDWPIAQAMAQKKTTATFRIGKVLAVATDCMSNSANNNCAESSMTGKRATRSMNDGKSVTAAVPAAPHLPAGDTPAARALIRHLYVHIPFCARICPYCAFYKDLLDRSQTKQFCEAILRELQCWAARFDVVPRTIFFGGGTPTSLSGTQLDSILTGFHQQLDLSQITEWTMEANPGSVSARKAALLFAMGVNRISVGVQSWDDALLKLLGREHNAQQAEESLRILREAGFNNINVDLMFGLPGQTLEQWRATLEKTIQLRPEHISAYCLTYEEDTEFFFRHARGEFRSNTDGEADFFELAISILADAGYEQYEISNYARCGHASRHNRAYWAGEDYLGLGPSAFSTFGMCRWQNVCDYREYAERVLTNRPPTASTERLTAEMKRTEKIALSLRTLDGIPAHLLAAQAATTDELATLGLLKRSNGNFVLTRAGKSLADSIAEALI